MSPKMAGGRYEEAVQQLRGERNICRSGQEVTKRLIAVYTVIGAWREIGGTDVQAGMVVDDFTLNIDEVIWRVRQD